MPRGKENLLLLFLGITVLLIVFYPSAGWKLRDFLSPAGPNGDSKNTALENESLKTELAKSRLLEKENPAPAKNFFQAFVYSSYPMNFKSRILTAGGEKDGVKKDQPVLIPSPSSVPVLVGRIAETFKDYSVAQTVFDSNFQTSVRIGDSGTDSLLTGGNVPKLTLIPKDAKIGDGDAVYSSSPEYPFGLPLGAAKNIRMSSDGFFQEADLETAYNPNDFKTVFINTNYNGRK